MSQNPFEVSGIPGDLAELSERSDGEILAGRGTRLAGAIIDGIIVACIVMPIQLLSGAQQMAMAGQTPPVMLELLVTFAGVAIQLLVNGWMLYSRGQSVGKRLLGIQIVDARDHGLLPFPRVFLIRTLWLLPLSFISMLLPSEGKILVSGIIGLLSLVDSLMIFGAEQRCLHDRLAGSKVVTYKEGRSRTAT
ncbi:MAG: hypothetical protein RLZZ436_3952 [Planctomycetota bacterium]